MYRCNDAPRARCRREVSPRAVSGTVVRRVHLTQSVAYGCLAQHDSIDAPRASCRRAVLLRCPWDGRAQSPRRTEAVHLTQRAAYGCTTAGGTGYVYSRDVARWRWLRLGTGMKTRRPARVVRSCTVNINGAQSLTTYEQGRGWTAEGRQGRWGEWVIAVHTDVC